MKATGTNSILVWTSNNRHEEILFNLSDLPIGAVHRAQFQTYILHCLVYREIYDMHLYIVSHQLEKQFQTVTER